MRRAAAVALAVLGLALLAGLLRMRADRDDELGAAQALVSPMARLGGLAMADDAVATQALAAQHRPHHLQLLLTDADCQPWLPTDPPVADAAAMRALLALHRRLSPSTEAQPLT